MRSITIESVNTLAAQWSEVLWAITWQFCVLGLAVLVLHLSLRRAAPNWRYWLWQMLAIKLLLMPFWTVTAPWEIRHPASPHASAAALLQSDPESGRAEAATANFPGGGAAAERQATAAPRHEKLVTEKTSAGSDSKLDPRQGAGNKGTGPGVARSELTRATPHVASARAKPSPETHQTRGNGKTGAEFRSFVTETIQSPAGVSVTGTMAPAVPTGRNPEVATQVPTTPTVSTETLSGRLVRTTGLTWQAWLMLGWAVGVVWIGSRIVWQGVALGRRLRQTEFADPALVQCVRAAAGRLGMTKIPAVRVIDLDVSPFVCGFWNTLLVIPRGLAGSFTPEQLDLVLLHELAHVRRRDLVWGWIPELAKVLYFFHPLVHFVNYQIRFERELACDQLAMVSSGRDVATYADTLVRVAGQYSCPDSYQLAAVESSPSI